MNKKHIFLAIALILTLGMPYKPACAQNTHRSADIFLGVDLGLSDMNYERQYDILLGLMPGIKWDLGNNWMINGGLYIPIVNQISYRYDGVRVTALDVSKQFKVGPLYCKASGGLFSMERYGLDLKMFLPIFSWFALEAQAGLTGRCTFRDYDSYKWQMSDMERFSGTVGGDIYLSRWNTQLRGTIGRYVYRDMGFECEAMRHFRHSTISVYGNWNHVLGFDGGFKVVAMIPPYKRTHRAVNIRPISNFSYDYTAKAHTYTNRIYSTDPEQNIRDGWFTRDFLDWGSHTMEPDFITKEKEAK